MKASMCSLSCSTEVNEAPVSEMTIRRSHGGTALFPLRVTGAGGTDSVRVMLRDLPETVWLSNGVRQDEHTWGLRLADLEDLHVTLGDVTPDTFDVTVEVASVAGTQVAKTVAHVRLSDRRGVAAAPAQPRSTAATIEDLLRAPVAPPQAPGVATPFRTEVKEVPRVEELAGAVPPTPPPTPAWAPFGNGASGN